MIFLTYTVEAQQNLSALKKNAKARAWYAANPERAKANARAWYAANAGKAKASSRARHLRRKYGLSPEQVEGLKEMQANKCAICKTPTSLVVDHDHKTGKVRGLLCHLCNSSLGGFRDSPELLQSAVEYLQYC